MMKPVPYRRDGHPGTAGTRWTTGPRLLHAAFLVVLLFPVRSTVLLGQETLIDLSGRVIGSTGVAGGVPAEGPGGRLEWGAHAGPLEHSGCVRAAKP